MTGRGRKRARKACRRCREQKIKCSGSDPCLQCEKRSLECQFGEDSPKVLVTQGYLKSLQQRLAVLENDTGHRIPVNMAAENLGDPGSAGSSELPIHKPLSPNTTNDNNTSTTPSYMAPAEPHGTGPAIRAPLTNPLAFHTANWVPGPDGRMLFMGTSSNWSFGRRVLSMTYEAVTGLPLPTENLLFDGYVYDLGWDGSRARPGDQELSPSALPTRDFALHLINTVKFHCDKLFFLIDDEYFMEQFAIFHSSAGERANVSPLWYVHYLIIMAFGKAFVVQISKSQKPPGAELFVQAMKLMPDLSMCEYNPIEKMQVLCSTALYLQCLNSRPAAYRILVQAVSVAFEYGMHTEMKGHHLGEDYVEKCRRIWWTVYILDRLLASLMGVPMMIKEECVNTLYPTSPTDTQEKNALAIQAEVARLLHRIQNTIYGIEGQLDSRYLEATRSVLRSIAGVADRLNNCFEIQTNENASGCSRVAAHLHLQHHQCIVLTTRPLLYTFLQSRLGHSAANLMHWLQSESVRGLLQICIESSRQILRILSALLNQGLLETFLPFDLDAVFVSSIALLLASSIDPSLVPDLLSWTQRSNAILSEMSSRGNRTAEMIHSELRMLEGQLNQLPINRVSANSGEGWNQQEIGRDDALATSIAASAQYSGALEDSLVNDSGFQCELSVDQLMELANSLDIDSLEWPLAPESEATNHTS